MLSSFSPYLLKGIGL